MLQKKSYLVQCLIDLIRLGLLEESELTQYQALNRKFYNCHVGRLQASIKMRLDEAFFFEPIEFVDPPLMTVLDFRKKTHMAYYITGSLVYSLSMRMVQIGKILYVTGGDKHSQMCVLFKFNPLKKEFRCIERTEMIC